ncbi:tetratricopeptide repeat protein [Nocardia terpenica]|uniref:Tetratricopeptide repeat protein n=1 Tax=Nocardia terpenica TaxID=455432 RepID=A0A6G9Z7P6_9NOCA|nr:tetratricopeptide repeat protein [Nocardia terpenica]
MEGCERGTGASHGDDRSSTRYRHADRTRCRGAPASRGGRTGTGGVHPHHRRHARCRQNRAGHPCGASAVGAFSRWPVLRRTEHAHPGQAAADPADVLATLLIDLGIAPGHIPDSLDARRDLWRDRLSDKRVLVVLDDARDRLQIEPLLPTGPQCLTLITSRRRFIALDNALPLALDTLSPDSAADLFHRLAQRNPSGDNAAAVTEIVRLCGYLPLAIVLLAGRLQHHPTWTLTDLATEFATAQDLLGELDTGDRAVRAAFTASYDNLPPARQQVFRRLGLHPGPDLDACAVAALNDIQLTTARHELDALYTDHLVDETTPGRYRLHDLLREYAHSLAATDPSDERADALDRLHSYYCHTAAIAGRYLGRLTRPVAPAIVRPSPAPDRSARDLRGVVEALAWMRRERANFLAFIDYAASRHQQSQAIELIESLASLLAWDGPWPRAAELHRQAIVLAQQIDDHLAEANSRVDLAAACQRTGNHQDAAEALQQAFTIYHRLGNRLGQANALNGLGSLHYRTATYQDATNLLQHALTIHRDLGDRVGQATSLALLGMVHWRSGDFPRAIDLLHQARALSRDLSNHHELYVLLNLGMALVDSGDPPAAIDVAQHVLTVARDLGNRLTEGLALGTLGLAHQRSGDLATAIELAQQAMTTLHDAGDPAIEAEALNRFGVLLAETRQHEKASTQFATALQLARRIHSPLEEARALEGLGRSRASLGDIATAITELRNAIAIYQHIGAAETESAAAYLTTLQQNPDNG